MGRPRTLPPAPSSLPRAILSCVAREGGDARALARRVGIDEAAVDERVVDVTPQALADLFEEAAAAIGEPFLALRVASELPSHDYGYAEMLARSSPTVGDAAQALASVGPLVHPELACAFERGRDEAVWRARAASQPRGMGRHAHEYGLAYVLSVARLGTGEPIAATRVWFAHARPPDIAPLHRFFGTRELAFGEEGSGMALSPATVALPMRGQDARLRATAKGLADAAMAAHPRVTALAEHVTRHVRALLTRGADMAAVAGALRMSPRTLQRRLLDEGTAYSELVDAVRQDVAKKSLRDASLPLAEIAYRAGFADLATFSRAFKRWTGMPPGMWRRR